MDANRRKGRPPVPEEKKRRKVSVTLPQALLARARDTVTYGGRSSLSELIEAALTQVLNEEDDIAKDFGDLLRH